MRLAQLANARMRHADDMPYPRETREEKMGLEMCPATRINLAVMDLVFAVPSSCKKGTYEDMRRLVVFWEVMRRVLYRRPR